MRKGSTEYRRHGLSARRAGGRARRQTVRATCEVRATFELLREAAAECARRDAAVRAAGEVLQERQRALRVLQTENQRLQLELQHEADMDREVPAMSNNLSVEVGATFIHQVFGLYIEMERKCLSSLSYRVPPGKVMPSGSSASTNYGVQMRSTP